MVKYATWAVKDGVTSVYFECTMGHNCDGAVERIAIGSPGAQQRRTGPERWRQLGGGQRTNGGKVERS